MIEVLVLTKDACMYCDQAKELLTRMHIPFKTRKLNEDLTREQVFEMCPGARTFPQIIIGTNVIGGYDELTTYIETTGFNGTGHSL
jgi:glutaredoxin 3